MLRAKSAVRVATELVLGVDVEPLVGLRVVADDPVEGHSEPTVRGREQVVVAPCVESDDVEAGALEVGHGLDRRERLEDRRPERHPGRCLDDERVEGGDALARDDDAVDPGRRGGPEDHADVGRRRHAVEHEHGAQGRRILGECCLERAHPRRHHVGEDALVLSAVAGELLDALGARVLHLDAAAACRLLDLAQAAAAGPVGDDDLVDVQVLVEEHLVDGVAAVDRDEAVLGGDVGAHRDRMSQREWGTSSSR